MKGQGLLATQENNDTGIETPEEFALKNYRRVTVRSLAKQGIEPARPWRKNAHAILVNERKVDHDDLPGTVTARTARTANIVLAFLITVSAVTAVGSFVYTEQLSHVPKAASENQAEVKAMHPDTPRPVKTDTVCKMSDAKLSRDEEGRYVVTLTVTSIADRPYDVYTNMSLDFEGLDSRSEPWKNSLDRINADTITPDVWSFNGRICVAALQPKESREVTLYPNLTNRSIDGITMTKVTKAHVNGIEALQADIDDLIHSVNDISYTQNMNGKGTLITIVGRPNRSTDRHSYTVTGALLDAHGRPFGSQRQAGFDFPFGIVTFTTEMAPSSDQGSKFQITCPTGTQTARAIICGVRQKNI